ncbi:tail fiber protein [Marinilongibacter aquaticus]|uniref:phage tail protein n=1 Tax=Marinilongibacter aquaticus TaxID=2975157 RepID=UPI0021BD1468|nr:tail fiber protein [Marinilongibacter aquaticus]UBM59616.1 tail fiber protein [Marinilongibacter aquaticus]
MSEPYVGEIRMFAGNFAPRSWAFCDGQLLAVSQNDALFSLFGTIYGGDGRTTFGLPDMRGRVPIHAGHGPGLSSRNLGSKGGVEKVTLTTNQMPSHGHKTKASKALANTASPESAVLATSSQVSLYFADPPNQNMRTDAIDSVGGSQSHTNLQPFLCINFIVALFGIYPSRG